MIIDTLSLKLFIPLPHPNLVSRRCAIRNISARLQSESILTLVSAPAGFGKTTRMIAWFTQIDHLALWLSGMKLTIAYHRMMLN